METFHLFSDIPQIHVAEDGPLKSDSSWPYYTNNYNQMDYSRHSGTKTVQVFGTELPMDEHNTRDMSKMQRYFNASPPFAPGCHYTDISKHGGCSSHQYFEHSQSLEP